MANPVQVHSAIDVYTAAQFPDVPVVFTNMDDIQASQGNAPWMKQKVVFREAKQFELGNVTSGRHWGAVVIIIYVRRGSGTLARDTLYNRVVDSFRSRVIGGATLLNVQPLIQGDNENWCLSGYQIPFYFNSI